MKDHAEIGNWSIMTNLDIIFYVVVSRYRFVKIGDSPQYPAEFRNGQLTAELRRKKIS